jgi:hypothetical protein
MKFVRTAKLGEVSWTFLRHNHLYRGRHEAATPVLGLDSTVFPESLPVWASSTNHAKAEIERLIVADPADPGAACDRKFAVDFLHEEPWSLASVSACNVLLQRCWVSWPGNRNEASVLTEEILNTSKSRMTPDEVAGHSAILNDLNAGKALMPFVVLDAGVPHVRDGAHRMTALFEWTITRRSDREVHVYYPAAHAPRLGFPTN